MAVNAGSPGEQSGSPADRPPLSGVRLVIVMAALMLSLLLEALDQTVVGTALPRIVGDLRGFDRYTWAVTAYLLASTIVLPLAGKLSDQFGRKWFLVGGVVLFLLGSLLCGAATTIDQLIGFRVLQGLGAGVGISLVFTAVADIFPPERRARWQGVLGSVYGISSVAGPTLGGWLADHGPLIGHLVTNASRWRWVFLVNLPLGIVALVALVVYLPTDISVRSSGHVGWEALRRIDLLGAALSVAASTCLLVALTEAEEAGTSWHAPRVLALLVTAVVLFLGLLAAERRAVEPILPFHLFRNRTFSADSALSVLLYMTLFGTVFFLPLLLQGVIGISATEAGIVMTPFSVSIVIGNALAGGVISRLQRYSALTVAGSVLMAAGVFLLTRISATTSLGGIAACVAVTGLAMGMLFTATSVAVQNTLPPTHLGVGFGIVRYLGQVGGTLGVAAVGAVVNGTFAGDLPRRIPAGADRLLSARDLATLGNPQVLLNAGLRHSLVQRAVLHAVSHAPSGTGPAAQAAAMHTMAQFFGGLRISLELAVRHGLDAAFLFALGAVVVSLLLRDGPQARA